MIEIGLAVVVFTALVMCLAILVLVARSRLVPEGPFTVRVNDERTVKARGGDTLHRALARADIHLPAACGGKGTCGLCRVEVAGGAAGALPVEKGVINRRDLADGVRLACQVSIREDLDVTVARDVFGARRWTCRVRSTEWLTPMIKELALELPEGESMDFRAGAFIQLTAPPFCLRLRDVQLPDDAREEWERLGVLSHTASSSRAQTRAYSMANHPGERGLVLLNVRLALPPPGAPQGTPPGVVSSYLFGLLPGDEVEVAGPFGEFRVDETEKELVFVGGGAGMAPMRAQILEQLLVKDSKAPITFWYGARSRRDLFYVDLFDGLAAEHSNFAWHAALSEPRTDDAWTGPTGFIHDVLRDEYLARHQRPEACEYYLCGPPVMLAAVRRMLDELGVEPESIHYDDFGG